MGKLSFTWYVLRCAALGGVTVCLGTLAILFWMTGGRGEAFAFGGLSIVMLVETVFVFVIGAED